MLLLGIGCSKNNDDASLANSAVVDVTYLIDAYSYDKAVPRLIISFRDFTVIEVVNSDNKNVLTFLFIDRKSGNSTLVSSTNSTVMFADYNPVENTMPDEVIFITLKEGVTKLIEAAVDWKTQTFTPINSTVVVSETPTLSGNTRAYNSEREIILNMLDKLGKGLSTGNKLVDMIPQYGSRLGDIFGIWDHALTVARYNMYMDDDNMQEQIIKEVVRDKAEDFVVNRVLTRNLKLVYKVFKATVEILKNAPAEIDDEEADNYVSCLCNRSKESVPMQIKVYAEEDVYSVFVDDVNVKETSASVSGHYIYNGGQMSGIMSMGFCYAEVGGAGNHYSVGRLKSCYIRRIGESYGLLCIYLCANIVEDIQEYSTLFHYRGSYLETFAFFPLLHGRGRFERGICDEGRY